MGFPRDVLYWLFAEIGVQATETVVWSSAADLMLLADLLKLLLASRDAWWAARLRPQHPARTTPAAVDVVLSIMDSASILKVIINIFNPF